MAQTSEPIRVVQLSDTHLSGKRAYSGANFDHVVDWLNGDPPALVVNTGDIALDDPDDDEDRAFARAIHRRIAAPVVAVPGNHDIGDSGADPWQGQRVDRDRLDRFVDTWGADRFCVDLGRWRLVGINDIVLGELADAEAETLDWLDEHVRGAEHVGVFLHKPLCVERLDHDDLPGWSLEGPCRQRLWSVLAGGPVRFVSSGHLHRSRSAMLGDGIAAVWAPSTAFIPGERFDGSVRRCGVMEWVFDGPSVRWSHVEPAGLAHRMGDEFKDGADAMRRAPLLPYEPVRPA